MKQKSKLIKWIGTSILVILIYEYVIPVSKRMKVPKNPAELLELEKALRALQEDHHFYFTCDDFDRWDCPPYIKQQEKLRKR